MGLFRSWPLACALSFACAMARAGTLATDGASYLGIWHGSTSFQGYDPNNGNAPTSLSGTIEWAVYAPGTFPAGFLGYTPTPGEFVYAYQAFETGSAPLSSFAVELLNPADNIGTFSGNGVSGDAPFVDFLIPLDSAHWLFSGVLQGGASLGLAFSSPFDPMFVVGTTIDHGSAAQVVPLPSPSFEPIPEPASLTLAALGAALVGATALRRKSRG